MTLRKRSFHLLGLLAWAGLILSAGAPQAWLAQGADCTRQPALGAAACCCGPSPCETECCAPRDTGDAPQPAAPAPSKTAEPWLAAVLHASATAIPLDDLTSKASAGRHPAHLVVPFTLQTQHVRIQI